MISCVIESNSEHQTLGLTNSVPAFVPAEVIYKTPTDSGCWVDGATRVESCKELSTVGLWQCKLGSKHITTDWKTLLENGEKSQHFEAVS